MLSIFSKPILITEDVKIKRATVERNCAGLLANLSIFRRLLCHQLAPSQISI